MQPYIWHIEERERLMKLDKSLIGLTKDQVRVLKFLRKCRGFRTTTFIGENVKNNYSRPEDFGRSVCKSLYKKGLVEEKVGGVYAYRSNCLEYKAVLKRDLLGNNVSNRYKKDSSKVKK